MKHWTSISGDWKRKNHSEEAEIKTQIIHKTRDSWLRKKALRENMTLKEILEYWNTLEWTDEQSNDSITPAKYKAKIR